MGCSVWAEDTVALFNNEVTSTARFICEHPSQSLDNISFPPFVIVIFTGLFVCMFAELAFYRFAHVSFVSDKAK